MTTTKPTFTYTSTSMCRDCYQIVLVNEIGRCLPDQKRIERGPFKTVRKGGSK